MNDTWHSFVEWWKEKTSSSLYFAFIISFLVWNWKSFYVLFSSPDIAFWIKFKYLASQAYCTNDWYCWIFNHAYALIPPGLMTFGIVVWLPKLNRIVHRIEVQEYFKRKKSYDEELEKYNSSKIQMLETQADSKKIEAKLIEKISVAEKQISKNLTQEEKWDKEYEEEFAQTNLFYTFKLFLQKVYSPSPYRHNFASEMLAVADSFSLINLNKDNEILLTEKGKYFSKLYSAGKKANK